MSSTEYYNIFGISAACTSFVSSIGLSILKFAKYNKLSLDYTKIYTYYFSLNNNIKRQLSLEKKERQDYYEYNKWLLFHLENLQNEMCKEFQEFPELMQLNIDLGLNLNNKMYNMYAINKNEKSEDESNTESSNASIEGSIDENEKNMFIINLNEEKIEDNEEDEEDEDDEKIDANEVEIDENKNIIYTEDRFHDGMMMYEIKRLRN